MLISMYNLTVLIILHDAKFFIATNQFSPLMYIGKKIRDVRLSEVKDPESALARKQNLLENGQDNLTFAKEKQQYYTDAQKNLRLLMRRESNRYINIFENNFLSVSYHNFVFY